MKFVQVEDGKQFEYQGRIYTKKGPLMAVDETGASKLLPRSAVVNPLTTTAATTPARTDNNATIRIKRAVEAVEEFCTEVEGLLDEVAAISQTPLPDIITRKLATARQALFDRLTATGD